MKSITKSEFIEVAKNLGNFYAGSDIALYSYAKDCNCISKTFNFMLEEPKTVGQVTGFIYNCSGRLKAELVMQPALK